MRRLHGREDVRRQALNVFRMRLLGAEVRTVDSGTRTLKDAINEALRDWVTNVNNTYYLLGSALGPHPYPLMVREFQSVIGREAREQIFSATGKSSARLLVACVGGGSNSIGLFHPFIGDEGANDRCRGRRLRRFVGQTRREVSSGKKTEAGESVFFKAQWLMFQERRSNRHNTFDFGRL